MSPSPIPTQGDQSVELTGIERRGRVQLEVYPTTPLELVVTEVANPMGQGFSILVVLEVQADDELQTFDVGAATPFPPGQGGVFVLPLPADAKAFIEPGGSAASVVLELAPLTAQDVLDEQLAVRAEVVLLRD